MFETLIAEIVVAILAGILLYKFFLRPKESNRSILKPVEPVKTDPLSTEEITPENITDKIREFIEKNDKIGAVKLVRKHSGMGLKDSKDFVDSVEKGQNSPIKLNLTPNINLDDSIVQEIITLLKEGKKIEAIKLVRLNSNTGLRDAKEYIEYIQQK